MTYKRSFILILLLSLITVYFSCSGSESNGPEEPDTYIPISLKSEIKNVQPMTGIVLWTTHTQRATDAISLEFSYLLYKDIVKAKGVYDWSSLDKLLDEIAARKHQAVIRFRYVYVGDAVSAVPQYIRDLPDYEETIGQSESKTTCFPDWRNEELQRFHLEFYEKFAERYDKDKRIAFLQTGFGLWAEYHIYDGPFILGKTFPSKEFQTTFFRWMEQKFVYTPWSVSIDAASEQRTPLASNPELKRIKFGLFDDSFMHENHANYNETSWNFFDRNRYKTSPAGGEFGYYTTYDQQHVLDYPDGIHGRNFETEAAKFHISYMIGNDQPKYQTMERIKNAGMACGYRYRITEFKRDGTSYKVKVKNTGVAPIYRDAYVAINKVRAETSLINLQPGMEVEYKIEAPGTQSVLAIECDHLVNGQIIEFEANL